ncbi:hypothetical protein FSW04_16950 [Baekduia soli]|uniref:Uncharacterized protein n=1 Tax=Baekduia soli TaxID=496014 RepID=A0A5B8U817_9ACTN|nr:hypothetical protein [Baekduia soli]QEC49097.1 hypothetical protein FSW04_16950 [Baekduia soli]
MLAALWFFTTRDDATTSAPVAPAEPGTALTAATPYDRDLRLGNVVLAAAPAQFAAAHALADDLAGRPTAALRRAGQAVLVRHAPDGAAAPGITAYARGRTAQADAATDPGLRTFVDYWLGRAAG